MPASASSTARSKRSRSSTGSSRRDRRGAAQVRPDLLLPRLRQPGLDPHLPARAGHGSSSRAPRCARSCAAAATCRPSSPVPRSPRCCARTTSRRAANERRRAPGGGATGDAPALAQARSRFHPLVHRPLRRGQEHAGAGGAPRGSAASGTVEILDGDEVRTYLSKGLGFSKEDRDTNIRRIGFVARLLARNGVVAIGAAISPYAETRDEVREPRRSSDGVAFVEVPCAARPRRAGRARREGPLQEGPRRRDRALHRRLRPVRAAPQPRDDVRSDQESVAASTARILAVVRERKLVWGRAFARRKRAAKPASSAARPHHSRGEQAEETSGARGLFEPADARFSGARRPRS